MARRPSRKPSPKAARSTCGRVLAAHVAMNFVARVPQVAVCLAGDSYHLAMHVLEADDSHGDPLWMSAVVFTADYG